MARTYAGIFRLVLLISSLLIVGSHSLQITTAQYQTKSTSFLGVPVTLREFQVKFDEEVYHLQADVACANLNCAAPANLSDPIYSCDATQPDWCADTTTPECDQFRTTLCNGSQPLFKVLQFDNQTLEHVDTMKENWYVYRTMDPCNYITINANPHWGDPNVYAYHMADFALYLDPNAYADQRPMREGGLFGPDRLSLCPGQTDYPFKLGCHVLAINPFDSLRTATGPPGTTFDLIVKSKPLPPAAPVPTTPCSVPPEAASWTEPDTGAAIPTSQWRCLDDGHPINFTSMQVGTATQYFVYSIPAGGECRTVYWYQSTYGWFAGYAIGASEVRVPYESTDFTATDWNLVSFAGNPKGDFLRLCSTPTEAFHFLMKAQPNPSDIFRTPEADLNYLVVDSRPGPYRYVEAIEDKQPYTATWDLQMSSQLRCRTPQGNLTKRQCNFRIDLYADASECSRFWHYYPSDLPMPIFPLNTWLFGDTRFVNFYPGYLPPRLDGKSYFAAALMTYQPDISKAPIQANGDTAEVLDTCEMTFMGSIVDSAGNSIDPKPFTFTERTTDCSADVYFGSVAPTFTDLSTRLTDTSLVPNDIRNLRVSMDLLTYAPAYSDCITYASSLAVTEPVPRTITSSICNPEAIDNSDPCCNSALSFTGPDCLPRTMTYNTQKFSALTGPAQAACQTTSSSSSSKKSTTCSTTFESDFVTALANSQSSLEGCGVNTPVNALFQGESLRTFRNISDFWLGPEPSVGHPCSKDSDCTLFASTTCDLLRGACNYRVDDLTKAFLNDWVPTLPYFLKSKTAEAIGAQNASDPASWFAALTTTSDCTGTYNWGWGYRNSYGRFYTVASNAPACNNGAQTAGENYCPERYCFGPWCTMDFTCQVALGANGACFVTFKLFPAPEADCSNSQKCNWTPNWNLPTPGKVGTPTTPANCSSTANICAVCEANSEQPCLGFEEVTSAGACTSQVACFLNNGTKVLTNSDTECQALESCSTTCYDSATKQLRQCTQTECESGSAGMCDSHYWSYSAAGTYRPSCIVPPTTLWGGGSDCPQILGEYGRSTPYGCIYYNNPGSCSSYGPGTTAYYTPTTQAACEAKHGCWQIWDQTQFKNDHMLTLKDDATCLAFGGQLRNFSTWKSATWAGGIARPLTWMATNPAQQMFTLKPTINIPSLMTSLQGAMDAEYAIAQSSETFCRYSATMRALGPVLCSCAADGQKTSEACFPPASNLANDPSTSSAQVRICPGDSYIEQRVAPVFLSINPTRVSTCHALGVNILSASSYAQTSQAALSTFLLDFSVSKPYQFTNAHGALVAQILGDGVIATTDMELFDTRICINPRADIQVNNSAYTVYDFATVDFSVSSTIGGAARPEILHLETYYDHDLDAVCTIVPSVDTSKAYFAVKRVDNDQTRRKNDFPAGETAFFAIMCILYSVACGLALFRFCATFQAGTFAPRNTQVWIFLTIGVMMFIRALYIILILAGVVIGNNSTAIDYILVELPSFLYLTIMTFFIIVWATLIRVNRKLSRRRNNANFWSVFFLINGVIYLIFIILIIIYESVKPKQSVLCGGRLAMLDQTVRQRTAVAYRAILAGFALIITLAFFITGSRIYISLRGASNIRATRKRKIFWLTTTCSVGLLALSTMLIVLAATGKQNNYAVLSLLVLFEAVPCTAVVVTMWDVKLRENLSDTGKTGRSTNSAQMRSMVSEEHTSHSKTSSKTGSNGRFSSGPSSSVVDTTDTDDDDDTALVVGAAALNNGADVENGKGGSKSPKSPKGKLDASSLEMGAADPASTGASPKPAKKKKKKTVSSVVSSATDDAAPAAASSPTTSPKPKKPRAKLVNSSTPLTEAGSSEQPDTPSRPKKKKSPKPAPEDTDE